MADPLPICYLNGDYRAAARSARSHRSIAASCSATASMKCCPCSRAHVPLSRALRSARAQPDARSASGAAHARGMAGDSRGAHPPQRRRGHVCLRAGHARHGVRAQSRVPGEGDALQCSRWHRRCPCSATNCARNGLAAITVEDFRWGRCDIKSTALLANVLMKQHAADAGAQEAIIVRDGEVLEGSSTSIFVVSNGAVATPPNSRRILPGTTRDAALELAYGDMPVEMRRITLDELRRADEVWTVCGHTRRPARDTNRRPACRQWQAGPAVATYEPLVQSAARETRRHSRFRLDAQRLRLPAMPHRATETDTAVPVPVRLSAEGHGPAQR